MPLVTDLVSNLQTPEEERDLSAPENEAPSTEIEIKPEHENVAEEVQEQVQSQGKFIKIILAEWDISCHIKTF